ncbi:MAG: nucleotide sugar dehydrogenase [Candidatus Binatus sp.]|uniref:UDP-glucose dehydrogenase family protein n=1 Tax=Candidatus Binatus sp. TaxID=2811406 RepID=UPI0027229831|nr:nucleotide sugar dehydrogenase [Candidatus Binatus sp.]MDO8432783.1 nucleotide sugar dehydrogenase [Candidatus Binatus sp.]
MGISVVGLGKLGACIAASAASKGMQVVGVDSNPRNVRLINDGLPTVVEPGLAEMISANRERLKATSDYQSAINQTDMTFVVVPTPSDQDGKFSLSFVLEALKSIGAALANKAGFHVVIITSTVLPGSTQVALVPALEKASGKKCGRDFGVCYNPEFIALGDVIHGLLNPDFILMGESDAKTGVLLEDFYSRFCDNHPPVRRMNFVNAELTKISVNTYVTTKISFANMLAAICEELPGGDVDVVTAALGNDARIGRRYLTGALGYGGPCFPRDNQALGYIARELGCDASLADATDKTNQVQLDRLLKRVRSAISPEMTVGVLGVAYKPDTNVVEESQGLIIAQRLASDGRKVIVFDPFAMDNARRVLNHSVQYAETMAECLRRSNALIIANPCREFRAIKKSDLPRGEKPTIVFDCWRILRDELAGCDWVNYFSVGSTVGETAGAARIAAMWDLSRLS